MRKNRQSKLKSAVDQADRRSPETDSRSEPDSTSELALPSPRDFPKSDVVIYDGDCRFCVGQVVKLAGYDRRDRIAFVSLHDPFVAERFPDLSHDDLMKQLYLIPADQLGYSSKRLGGAAAIRYLSLRLPKLWLLAPVLHFPFSLPLWQACYRQIAKRRYRIAGKRGVVCDDSGSCELHFKEKR